jgi:hypothetical protein
MVRPAHLTMACGNDRNPNVEVTWTSWTANAAIGTGTVTLNTCIPACADSSFITYPATITVSDDVLGMFQDLTITPTGASGNVENGSQPGRDWGYLGQ